MGPSYSWWGFFVFFRFIGPSYQFVLQRAQVEWIHTSSRASSTHYFSSSILVPRNFNQPSHLLAVNLSSQEDVTYIELRERIRELVAANRLDDAVAILHQNAQQFQTFLLEQSPVREEESVFATVLEAIALLGTPESPRRIDELIHKMILIAEHNPALSPTTKHYNTLLLA